MSQLARHKTCIIPSKNAQLAVVEAEIPSPAAKELLVKVKAIGISPIEAKQQRFELHPFPYPQNIGLTYAGVVERVGPGVESFVPGDRIVAARAEEKLDDPRYGSFQQYAIASTDWTAKLLPDTSLEAAAAVLLNLATISGALTISLGLGQCNLSGETELNGKRVLVYGGSSSTGGLAINYLVASGYDVVTTSSRKNWNHVISMGAENSNIIDHNQSADRISEEIRVKGPYDAVLDVIGGPVVTRILSEYISSTGGGAYNTLIPPMSFDQPLPKNVERRFESYGWLLGQPQHAELRRWFFEELVPLGLSKGVIIPTPQQPITGGLDSTQHALDLLFNGEVSGAKLVLNPWECP